MDDADFLRRQFGQPKDTNIRESLVEIFELNNFKEEESYIILNNVNQFKMSKLTKIVIIPELTEGKKKYPKVYQLNFNSEFVLNKHFNGSIDEWKDLGGELFSKYRVFHIIHSDNIQDELSKLTKTVVKKEDFKIINEARPNIKFREKYLKYKAKYISLKKSL